MRRFPTKCIIQQVPLQRLKKYTKYTHIPLMLRFSDVFLAFLPRVLRDRIAFRRVAMVLPVLVLFPSGERALQRDLPETTSTKELQEILAVPRN